MTTSQRNGKLKIEWKKSCRPFYAMRLKWTWVYIDLISYCIIFNSFFVITYLITGCKRYCKCSKCQRIWISNGAFYNHQLNHINSFGSTLKPEFPWTIHLYEDERFKLPLFKDSHTTVVEAITKHLFIFSMNYGMSKSALNDSLHCEKRSLPQTYVLSSSYTEAKSLIPPLLMPVEKYDAYINDCVIDQDSSQFQYLSLSECLVCQVPRKSHKIFTYMPLGPRLARWYNSFNLCKLIHSNKISVSKKEFFGILQTENYLNLG